MSKRDYYEVLGVKKDASPDELKKAFRKKAVQLHPDKEGGDEKAFKEANEAYEILKDKEKRQRYDQFGHAGVGGGPSGGGGNPFGGFGGQGQNVHFDFGGGFGDIFSDLFGGGFGDQSQSQRNRQARGRDVEVDLTLNFKEAIFGTDTNISININDKCNHCKGKGAEPGFGMRKCPDCDGKGQRVKVTQTLFGPVQQATTCTTCSGSGNVPEKECSICNGQGVTRQKQDIKLKVPAGIDDGATIRLNGRGEAVKNGKKGDLYVNIRVKADKKFTREGNLVLSEEKISMIDAALGVDLEVETVDGPVVMKVPAGTQSHTDFKLNNHGVPHLNKDRRGAHIVTIVVETPTRLNKKQKKILEEFQGAKKGRF